MNEIPVSEINDNIFFDAPVYLDEAYILLSPDVQTSTELFERLQRWSFPSIATDGTPKDAPSYLAGDQTVGTANLDTDIKEKRNLEVTKKHYYTILNYTKNTFALLQEKNSLDQSDVSDRIKEMIEQVKTRGGSLLRYIEHPYPAENYLVRHCVNVTILALSMGEILKLPPHRMIDLGMAALLHDIGMLKIPERIYLGDKPLTADEAKMIRAHTLLGYRMLKGFSLSDAAALAAAEHHERINGSGYPRGLQGDKITLYGRILAVACSYDAITSERPYKARKNGHTALLELLKARQTLYDEKIIRVLVFTISLYPIGNLVMLSDGCIGRVVQANSENPKLPDVQILMEASGEMASQPRMLRTADQDGIMIQRIVDGPEAQALGLN